jgi:hypothetical protein
MDPDLSLRICTVLSGSMLFAISFSTCKGVVSEQHGSWSDCADEEASLDPCWSQTHYVGFVIARLYVVCYLEILALLSCSYKYITCIQDKSNNGPMKNFVNYCNLILFNFFLCCHKSLFFVFNCLFFFSISKCISRST